METWKLLLITLLSAVVLGCIIGVATGKHQVKKAKGDYRPLLTVRERVVYALLVLFGAGCIAIGVFVAPGLGAADEEIIYDEFGNPMPADGIPGEFAEAMPGDIMVNNAAPDAYIEGGVIEGEAAEEETLESEPTEAEPAEDETAEEETAEGEIAEGEAAEDEIAEEETEATEAEVAVEPQHNMPAPPRAGASPARRIVRAR